MASLAGCKKEEKYSPPSNDSVKQLSRFTPDNLEGGEYREGKIILGRQLTNPYTISSMDDALASLNRKGIISGITINIRPTHYYVKFKPDNWDQYTTLGQDSSLKLYDYPLDYDIEQTGNRYHDPAVAPGLPTYQYASVPSDYVFTEAIPYEILSSLYIPEVDRSLPGTHNENKEYVDLLLDEAYKQTQNYGDTITIDPQTGQRRPPYTPSGTILINDTRLATNIGMEGVEVRARRWFITYTDRPDFNGNYTMDNDFRRESNYSLWFIQPRFSVRQQFFGTTAMINGPKQTGPWNHTIRNGYDRFIGHIFRGANRYHYGNIDGLQRPYRWVGLPTIYIGKDGSRDWAGINWIVFPIIKIARYADDAGDEFESDEVFSTTCHETGHTSHVIKMNAGPIQYWQVSGQLQESWPVAIEWWLTRLEYRNTRGIVNYGGETYNQTVLFPNQYGYQYWNRNLSADNTSLYINLIDNHNELNQPYPFRPNGIVNDQVTGYTIALIEDNIIKHTYGLSSLAENLKDNKPAGVTDAQIDLLLNFY